jgi:acylphosphatase
VANLADPNRLELEAEGNDQAIASMEQAIRRGPPGARVRDVSITPISPENRPGRGFEIR